MLKWMGSNYISKYFAIKKKKVSVLLMGLLRVDVHCEILHNRENKIVRSHKL